MAQRQPRQRIGTWSATAACVLLAFPLAASAETIAVKNVAGLQAAIAKARTLRAAKPTEPVVIELAAGTYELGAPLKLDAGLSGTPGAVTTIRSAPGAKATLSAGRSLGPLRWEAQPDGVWRARVKGPRFLMLWRDGKRQILARYPNYDPAILPLNGFSADATSPARVARWSDPTTGVIHAIHASRWGDMHLAILGKNLDGTLKLAQPTGNNRDMGASETERYVENIREELDAADEWFFDTKQGWLYYKPADGKQPSADGFVASHLDMIAQIGGASAAASAHDITLAGLDFRYTAPTYAKTTEPLLRSDWEFHRGGGVLIENARDVHVEDSNFTELGGNGVVVSGYARKIAIRRNEIAQIGASAISFVGRPDAVRSPLFEYHQSQPLSAIDRTPGPKSDTYPADSSAEDNLIHDNGFVEKQSAGVQIAMSARISVVHNSIYRLPRSGINVGDGTWGGHQIIGNDVFDTVLETGDHGSYNSWGRDRFWDPDRAEMERRTTAERSLVKLDAMEPIVIRHNRFRCDHGWDVDLDDGSSNYIIEDNLMLTGGLKFREGFDRIARNNILLNNTFHPHVWFQNSEDVFEHNIVMSAYQPIRVPKWGHSVDRNLFPTKGALDRARANGTDRNSTFGAPQFVDPKSGNYAVAPGSPALKIGFRNFAMNDFGVRPADLKARAETPKFPEPVAPAASGQQEAVRMYAGMQLKSVETLGEQSAAGLPRKAGVIVISVETGGRAARAGLQAGDVILAIAGGEGEASEQTDTATDFVAAAQGRHWRGEIEVEALRNQKQLRLKLDVR